MKEQYDTLVIGSTFFGLGLASNHLDNVLIVERSTKLGHEFINTLNPGAGWTKQHNLSPLAEEFHRELIERNILAKNGNLHLPALEPMLCEWVLRKKINPCLMTDIVHILPNGSGFTVTLNTVEGMKTLTVSRIIDTLGDDLKKKSKVLNAILFIPDDFALPLKPWSDECEFIEGGFKHQVTLSLKIEPDDNWLAARHKMHRFWETRPDKYRSVTIAAVADFFVTEVQDTGVTIPGYERIMSNSFKNPLLALDAGIRYKRDDNITYSEIVNKHVPFPKSETPAYTGSYDVIVVGMGTAGALAVITAAGHNLSVLGIDKLNCMGGTATAGGVTGYYFGGPGGLFEEIDDTADSYKGTVYTYISGNNPEAKKYVLEQRSIELGAELEYNAVIIGVHMEGKRVKGVRILTDRGVLDVSCKVLIDCTGEAEICRLAGCSVKRGRDSDSGTMPFTSVMNHRAGDTIVRTNFDIGLVDQSSAADLSKAIITSSSYYLEPKFEDDGHTLIRICQLPGIREGYRIEGESQLRLEDCLEDCYEEQPVFYAYADVDKHGLDNAFENEMMQQWHVASNLGAVNISVGVPFKAMIPMGFKGILAAGRCMSVDRDLLCCIRMVRDMQKSGEAAATLAYIAIDENCELTDVPYERLATLLRETGCLNDDNNLGIRFDSPRPEEVRVRKIHWLTEPIEIKEGLKSDKPGIAIWSSKRLGGKMSCELTEWLTDENENLRKHAAFALALMGSDKALPILRTMIRERDSFMLGDCRKWNQMRGYIAIYLAGCLRDVEVINDLIDIITNTKEYDHEVYHKTTLLKNHFGLEIFNNVYYQFLSFSVSALIKIADSYEQYRPVIEKAFNKAFMDGNYINRIVHNDDRGYEYQLALRLKDYALAKIKRL